MKRRNYKHLIRRSHRYLGIFIGIQFMFWTIGGLYFSWTNIKEIRGDHLQSDHDHSIALDKEMVSPQIPAQKLVGSEVATSIEKIRVVNVLGTPHYEIGYRTRDDKDEIAVANARTGEIRPAINEDEAIRIATDALSSKKRVKNVSFITEENVGGHHEYRGKPLPAWAVSFENTDSLTVYLSAQTGEIGSFRTGNWRIFDFLWMLHIMDFHGRDNFNNYLLRAFSLFGIFTICSGFALFFVSSPYMRRLFHRKLPV